MAAAQLIRGWSLVFQGAGDSGLEYLRQSVAAYRATGAELHVTSILLMLAEACGYLGYTQEGLAVLDEALALGRRNGEWHYEAELYRLKGELLLAASSDTHPEAMTCFQQVLTIARQQRTRAWELRTAMSLSRLWQRHGHRAQAQQCLASCYKHFTEGGDTGDLQAAQALLIALA